MKKGFLFLAIMLAGVLMASMVMADCWTDYKSARTAGINCEEEGNTACAVDSYLQAREKALALTNYDGSAYQAKQIIADWQTVRAANVLYKAFLKIHDYELLEQAKAILIVNVINGPPADKAKGIIEYCTRELKAKADAETPATSEKQ